MMCVTNDEHIVSECAHVCGNVRSHFATQELSDVTPHRFTEDVADWQEANTKLGSGFSVTVVCLVQGGKMLRPAELAS